MSAVRENTLELPLDLVRKMSGFSCDIGGSMCKIVYKHKDDWKELEKSKLGQEKGKVRLTSFRSEDVEEALQWLKEHCELQRSVDEPKPTVYMTGIGSNMSVNRIRQFLDVKVENFSEFDCHSDAFVYLSRRLPFDQFTIPRKNSLPNTANETAQNSNELANSACNDSEVILPAICSQKVDFPALYVMCGSIATTIKIYQNGDFAVPDSTGISCRMILGLGSLLTGAKTYDDIIDLASKGNNSNIDLSLVDIDTSKAGPPYPESCEALGHFGQATGRTLDDFKREDLALSLLHMMTQQLAQLVIYSALRTKCYTVFFGGSFLNRELVSDVLEVSFRNRLMVTRPLREKVNADIDFHFLRNGAHFGAIGAFLSPFMNELETIN